MNKNIPMLMNLLYYGFNRALPSGDLAPQFNPGGSIKTTFCNQFIQYVLNGFGYGKMNGLLANQMFDFLSSPGNGWISVSDDVAQSHANNGVIVLASHKKEGSHGHICVIVPGIIEKSHTWGKAVPKCVNVGKDVFFGKKVSFAFTKEEMPVYFALGEMI